MNSIEPKPPNSITFFAYLVSHIVLLMGKTILKSEREKRGWTQQQLGVLARVGASDVQRIETRRMIPYPTQAEKLAKVLGVRPDELQGEAR